MSTRFQEAVHRRGDPSDCCVNIHSGNTVRYFQSEIRHDIGLVGDTRHMLAERLVAWILVFVLPLSPDKCPVCAGLRADTWLGSRPLAPAPFPVLRAWIQPHLKQRHL